MSLIFAEMGSRMEKKRLEKRLDSLVPGKEYKLYPYKYQGQPDPEYVAVGVLTQRVNNLLYFDNFTVQYFNHDSLAAVIRGFPKLLMDNGTEIANIVEQAESSR